MGPGATPQGPRVPPYYGTLLPQECKGTWSGVTLGAGVGVCLDGFVVPWSWSLVISCTDAGFLVALQGGPLEQCFSHQCHSMHMFMLLLGMELRTCCVLVEETLSWGTENERWPSVESLGWRVLNLHPRLAVLLLI